ncbi:hypothetical protein D3C86_2051410 [compost metagenome]
MLRHSGPRIDTVVGSFGSREALRISRFEEQGFFVLQVVDGLHSKLEPVVAHRMLDLAGGIGAHENGPIDHLGVFDEESLSQGPTP